MGGRPTTRTATVEGAVMDAMRGVFGSAANAYANLRIVEGVSYSIFVRSWAGRTVTPAVATAIEGGWRGFLARMAAQAASESGRGH